jgi:alcohol dehydrogenase (NADP+)
MVFFSSTGHHFLTRCVAYSPFGNANPVYDKGKGEIQLMQEPTLVEIGKKYNKSGAQIALKWGIQRGCSVIPKSKTPSRIRQNAELGFELTEEEMRKINELDRKLRLNDPSKPFKWNFYADLDGKK